MTYEKAYLLSCFIETPDDDSFFADDIFLGYYTSVEKAMQAANQHAGRELQWVELPKDCFCSYTIYCPARNLEYTYLFSLEKIQ